MILILLFFFLVGLFFGSFFTVLIDRIPIGKSFLFNRSHCDHCHKRLQPIDLIPLVSFLSTGGKCRYCKKKLTFFYPLIELVTGILFVLVALPYSLQLLPMLMFTLLIQLVFALFVSSSLLVIFFTDLRYGIIPDKIVFPAAVIALFYLFFFIPQVLLLHIYSGLGSGVFFLIIFLLAKGKGMGFGDVKFAFLMGLLLGYPYIVLALYIAFLTAAFVSLILILWGKKTIKATIPFGPFLAFSTLLLFLYAKEVLETIVHFFPTVGWILV